MTLTVVAVKEELTHLLRVGVDDPKWSQTRLLNLPLVERQFEASRHYGVQPAEANLNLAICILQSTNQLVPPSAVDDASTWKMLIGSELNCLAAVRGYVAGVMAARVSTSLTTVLRECANHTSVSASELIEAKPPILQKWSRRAVTTLWLWKTGVNPVEGTATEWHDLINQFSSTQVWTRDTIYSQREKLIATLAKLLVSKQALSQPIGLGPQVLEAARMRTSAVPSSADRSGSMIASAVAHQEIAAEPVSPINPSVKPAIDPLDLYLKHVLPPAPTYVPDEWRMIITVATHTPRLCLQGTVGSGKTHLLYALGHELRQAGQVPLYIHVSDYARQAADMDIIQFAATAGAFWQTFHDQTSSQEFAKALAAAQQANRLVVLADQCDDLFENEWLIVSQALNRFQWLIVAERTPRLSVDRAAATTTSLPALSVPALIELARTSGLPDLHDSYLIELQQQGLELTPAIVSVVGQIARTTGDFHPVAITKTWIDDLLRRVRSTNALVAEENKARLLLQKLARIHQQIDWPRGEPNELADDTAIRVFRDPALELRDQAEGRILLDFCARAGLLAHVGPSWQFTSPTIERFFAAEYAMRETWTSLWPRWRTLMAWTTALLVRHGSSRQQERFFAQLNLAMERVTDLSSLEAMDILEEAGVDLSVALNFKDATLRRFKNLAKVESDAVRYAVQLRAERHGLKVGLSRKVEPPPDLIPGQVLDSDARDLSELLRQLGLKPPKGREDQWLDDRGMLNALIEGLRTQRDPIIRHQCAAWLRRSALAKFTEIQIPSQPLRSRLLTALEVLAEIANDPSEHTFARLLAKSVLAKDEFVLQLWKSRKEYIPLVYELLLAMDKRLFSTQTSPDKQDWYIAG